MALVGARRRGANDSLSAHLFVARHAVRATQKVVAGVPHSDPARVFGDVGAEVVVVLHGDRYTPQALLSLELTERVHRIVRLRECIRARVAVLVLEGGW